MTREATVSKKEIVQIEGDRQVSRLVDVYNLDAIIAVGTASTQKKSDAFPPMGNQNTARIYSKRLCPSFFRGKITASIEIIGY